MTTHPNPLSNESAAPGSPVRGTPEIGPTVPTATAPTALTATALTASDTAAFAADPAANAAGPGSAAGHSAAGNSAPTAAGPDASLDATAMFRPGALEGIRVLDVTQVMAGSFCGMLLADLGADVIKVERPGIGDMIRWAGDGVDAFAPLNRNKRSIAIDYRHPDGADALRRLAAGADVLVENHRPGTLVKHGLGPDDLRAINPRLVYCSISGFGATGPRAGQSGFDLIAQGMSGIMSVTGEPGGEPCKVGVPIADLNAGMFATIGVLAALAHRERTGEGQTVSTSLLESSIAYLVWESMMWFQGGTVAERGGSAHRLSAPYEAFRTEDGWITIAAPTPDNFATLCACLGTEHLLDDPRFATPIDRLNRRNELAREIEEVTTTKPSAHWSEVLLAHKIASGPIHRVDEVWDDPQVLATEMVVGEGAERRLGHPIKMAASPMAVTLPSPDLGEHTRDVLIEAGYDEAEVDRLFAAGAVAEPAVAAPAEAGER